MGEAVDESFSQMAPEDIHALVAFLRSVPPIASPDLPATLAPPAPASPKDGAVADDALGKKIFADACASCHSWTGVSALTPFATIAGVRAVNDPTATNVAQIVISGTRRTEPRRRGVDAGLRQHLLRHRNRRRRELRYGAFRQREVLGDRERHRGFAQANGPARSHYDDNSRSDSRLTWSE